MTPVIRLMHHAQRNVKFVKKNKKKHHVRFGFGFSIKLIHRSNLYILKLLRDFPVALPIKIY